MAMKSLMCIDPATLSAWLAGGNTVVIDVREPGEHARAHIRGSRLMPLSRLDVYAVPPNSQIVLYCASGCRSKTAARRLGLDGLAHLEGGLAAWIDAGFPTIQGQTQRLIAARFEPLAQHA
jgi:adenylyltransferase/sulfurtransferase